MVVSSSVLVSSTNVASDSAEGKNFLFGYWNNQEAQSQRDNKIDGQASPKNNLALVHLVKSNTSPNKNANFEEEKIDPSYNQALLANSGPSPLKDPQEGEGVIMYTVKDGDTLSSIAHTYEITTNTILWANDIDNMDSIRPGDKLFILPIAGVTHTVQDGDTIDSIVEKYNADKNKIISFNILPANGKLEKGQEIIIPDGEREVPQRQTAIEEEEDSSGLERRQYATPSGGTPTVSNVKKLEGKAGTGHKFPYGYCTWYVAQKRYVPWGGNAGTWLYNAKAMGYKTGKTPKKGSILVTSESWWGHVAVVESVGDGTITVSEMNYKGWGKVSSRTISVNNRVIKGYIY